LQWQKKKKKNSAAVLALSLHRDKVAREEIPVFSCCHKEATTEATAQKIILGSV
jgi:hypothetical protein